MAFVQWEVLIVLHEHGMSMVYDLFFGCVCQARKTFYLLLFFFPLILVWLNRKDYTTSPLFIILVTYTRSYRASPVAAFFLGKWTYNTNKQNLKGMPSIHTGDFCSFFFLSKICVYPECIKYRTHLMLDNPICHIC